VALNPLHGPGLMILAGCETMGDGNGGGKQDKSIPVTLDNQTRVLLGFKKCGDARDILRATEIFLENYFLETDDGTATLGEALARANDYLQDEGSSLTMETLPETDLNHRFLTRVEDYWTRYADDGPPEQSSFNTNINIVNKCTGDDGSTYQEDEQFATAWSNETVFDGPFFSGSRVNPQNQVDFEFNGALMDIREGAHFFFVVQGSLNPRVQGLTVYGDALIDSVEVDTERLDAFTIKFKGQGKASPYTNEEGDTCQMQDPLLVSSTGALSTLKVPVTWKKKDER